MKLKRITAAFIASLMLALTACTESKVGLTPAGDPITTTTTTTTQQTTSTTTSATTTASSSEQSTAQQQTTTKKAKVTAKPKTTTTTVSPNAPSGVKTAKDLIALAQSIYKQDMDTAASTVAQSLNAKLGKRTDEEYYADVQGRIYDQSASKMNVMGVAMNEMTIETFKNGDTTCGLLAFHLYRNDDVGQTTGAQAKAAYDTLYNQLKAVCGEPSTTIEDAEKGGEKSDYSKYYWVQWDTPDGTMWLCWGTDMWQQKGYNNCILSVSHPDRTNQ